MPNLSPQPLLVRYLPDDQIQRRQVIVTTITTTIQGGFTVIHTDTISELTTSSPSSSSPGSISTTQTGSTGPASTTGSTTSASSTIPVTSSSSSSSPSPPSTASTPTSNTTSKSTSSSTSSSTGFPTAVGDQGLSPGTVAGIGIGTFFAGVLLALVCLFAMLRRRKRRSHDPAGRRRPYRDSDYSQENDTPMKQMASTVQPLGAGNNININRVLLEPVSSSDIKRDMLAMGSQILQHVDNNYHLKPVDSLPASFTESLTQERYSDFTGISIEQLGKLLRNVQTRRAAIRHLISYFIFSGIALTSDVETSLLPSHIIAFLRQMPPPERTSGSREAFDLALTKWRLISAYLLQTVRSNRDPLLPKESDIQPAITRNVAAVRQILTTFVVSGAERRQAENLQGLMAEGARFGLLLFQQPASWVVDWEIPNTKHANTKIGGSGRAQAAAVVLFPGLIKTVDEEGKRYIEVRNVLDAEVLEL